MLFFYINSLNEWKNSVDPDQMASEEAIWSGSTLFSKAMPILVQQDKGYAVFTSPDIWFMIEEIKIFRDFLHVYWKTMISLYRSRAYGWYWPGVEPRSTTHTACHGLFLMVTDIKIDILFCLVLSLIDNKILVHSFIYEYYEMTRLWTKRLWNIGF